MRTQASLQYTEEEYFSSNTPLTRATTTITRSYTVALGNAVSIGCVA